MQDFDKPADAEGVAYALRLGWQIAELRGRFWRRVREGPPEMQLASALRKDNALPLEDERLETSNIDRLPGLLMSAILESARGGERDEEKLAAAALRRLDLYEFELEQAAAVPLQ